MVTDGDTPRNGPPFSFHIVSGNEDHRFHVDQGGLLSLSAPLKKRVKPRHQLKIQVRLYPLCAAVVTYLSSVLSHVRRCL